MCIEAELNAFIKAYFVVMLKMSKSHVLVSLCIALWLFISPAFAQLNNVVLDRLTVEDGLSQASMYDIMQDQQGFMWFGSESGINIYDGYNVSTLRGPIGEFPTLSVNSITQSKNGLMWLSFWNKGLYTYDPKTGAYDFVLATDPKNAQYTVFDVVEDDNNDIWVVTDKSIILYHPTTKKFSTRIDLTDYLNVKLGYIHKVKYHDNKLFIGTQVGIFVYAIIEHKLVKISGPSASNTNSTDFDEKNALKTYNFSFHAGEVYTGTHDGVFSFTLASLNRFIIGMSDAITYDLILPHASVWEFAQTANAIYIANAIGLHRINTATKQAEFLFEFSDYDKTIANANIYSIFIDQKGLIWLGSVSSGAFIWDPASELVRTFGFNKDSDAGLLDNSITALFVDEQNSDELWVGSEKGLNVIDLDSGKVGSYLINEDPKAVYSKSDIQRIQQDSQQRLWITTSEGIHVFDKAARQLISPNFPPEILSWLSSRFAITYLQQDILWIIDEVGFYQLDINTGDRLQHSLPQDFDINTVYNILSSPSGDKQQVVISTHDTLWQFDVTRQTFSILYQHPGIISNAYTYIDNWVLDNQNTLWLSFTGIGLIGLDANDTDNVKYFFNFENSGLEPNLYSVQVDADDNIWFSSHSGIYRLDKTRKQLRKFSRNDGFNSVEFNSSATERLANGQLVFGGVAGISMFDPLKLGSKRSLLDYKVSIANVSTLSRDIKLPLIVENEQEIALEYDDVGIRIDFTSFNYGKQERPEYAYQFVGGVQYPLTKQNYVLFPSLEPGKHTFEVRVKSPESGILSAPARLVFKVSYAPWLSPKALIVYLLCATIIFCVWLRARYVRQKELLMAHEQVKYRENRLQLALQGSNSEVWDWQAKNNQIYGKRLVVELGYDIDKVDYSFEHHLTLIHNEDRRGFLAKWQAFIAQQDANIGFEYSYRLLTANNEWLWFKDLGKAVDFDQNNNVTRVTGSYTNITESKANFERAQYYGAAFEHTKDWVLIIDENFAIARANKSMAQAFGWTTEEQHFNRELLGLSADRLGYYSNIFPEIVAQGHWRGEDIIRTPSGQEYHVIVNVSVSQSKMLEQTHYICVFTDITALKSAEKELRYMANYDHLTGLPNRTLLLDRVTHALEFSARQQSTVALFFIDLDRFKQVNDSLGHDYGDLLLKEVTERLTSTLRVDDTVARIGGDEFVVLLESYKNNSELSFIAQKIIDVVEQPITLEENIVSVGASIGISVFPNDSKNSDELLRHADVAMYHAKQMGRNNYQFFTESMNDEAKERLSKESNLKLAVANDDFFNLYQPIIDTYTGKAVGVELLMRWQYQDRIVSPVEFITLSEELGLIVPMTERAIEKAFVELKVWRGIRPNYYVSVNFSAEHFSHDSLVPSIQRLLEKHQLPASALKIEVTENAFISDPERAIKTMHTLKSLGVKLSLDDFGTGFSSLSYLKRLPLDIIKIDRSFISGIGHEKTDEAIVDATLVLAKSLNMYCIAEGVETLEQIEYLVNRQCHYIQGYFYYKPLTAELILNGLKEDITEMKILDTRSSSGINALI